jgi:hypothetical protein
MKDLSQWFSVHFDDQAIHIHSSPPGAPAWQAHLPWQSIKRVCFQANDYTKSDTVYLFTTLRPLSYVFPVEASGGLAVWEEIIARRLFDPELAFKAAAASGQQFCTPPIE